MVTQNILLTRLYVAVRREVLSRRGSCGSGASKSLHGSGPAERHSRARLWWEENRVNCCDINASRQVHKVDSDNDIN
jgi:hypothetical protein